MSSTPSYSAPPRRAGAPSGAGASASFSSFGRPPRPDGGAGGDSGYGGSGSSGTGGYGGGDSGYGGAGSGASNRSEFDSAASAAFGKKPVRTFDEPAHNAEPPKVTPARNTLASILESLLPPDPEPKEREWSRSALKNQRKAAVDAEKSKPPPKKSFEDEFPTLGGAGAAGGASAGVRIPKMVFAEAPTEEAKQAGSFASLAAGWAKSEEERKAAEAIAARVRFDQQQHDDYERSQRTQFYFNRNSGNQSYNYDAEFPCGEDEYVEGELGEDECSAKIRRDDLRAAANHYSDEEEVDEDHADYNIGTGRTWQ
jgi:hypothetical protein